MPFTRPLASSWRWNEINIPGFLLGIRVKLLHILSWFPSFPCLASAPSSPSSFGSTYLINHFLMALISESVPGELNLGHHPKCSRWWRPSGLTFSQPKGFFPWSTSKWSASPKWRGWHHSIVPCSHKIEEVFYTYPTKFFAFGCF